MTERPAYPALSRFVGDAAAFLDNCWGQRSLLRRAATRDAPAFDDLLTVADVDRLVASTQAHVPDVNLIQDGLQVDAAEFSHPPDPRRGGARVIDAARVYEYFHAGATIQMQGVHFRHAPLAVLCRRLELELTVPVQINLYVTPPHSRGLALHADTHDVLVLQVAGTKHWDVFEAVAPGTDLDDPAQEPALAFQTELARGDVLYLPRGVPHRVASTALTSIHLTVGFVPPSWREVIDDVVSSVLDDLERGPGDVVDGDSARGRGVDVGAATLEGTLPARFALDDGASVASMLADRLRLVADRIAALDAAAAARRVAYRFWAERAPVLQGQLGQLMGLDDIGPHTALERPPSSLAHVVHDDAGDELVLVLGDRSLKMPADLEPAIEFILSRPSFRVEELEGLLDPASRLVLVRRLVREGVLARARGFVTPASPTPAPPPKH